MNRLDGEFRYPWIGPGNETLWVSRWDIYPVTVNDPCARFHSIIDEYLDEVFSGFPEIPYKTNGRVIDYEKGRSIKGMPESDRIEFAAACLVRMIWEWGKGRNNEYVVIPQPHYTPQSLEIKNQAEEIDDKEAIERLEKEARSYGARYTFLPYWIRREKKALFMCIFRQKLPWTEERWQFFFDMMDCMCWHFHDELPLNTIFQQLERYVNKNSLSSAMRKRLIDNFRIDETGKDKVSGTIKGWRERVDKMLNITPGWHP